MEDRYLLAFFCLLLQLGQRLGSVLPTINLLHQLLVCRLEILGRKWFGGADVVAGFAQQLTVELIKLLLVDPEVGIGIHAKDWVIALLALQELEVPLR